MFTYFCLSYPDFENKPSSSNSSTCDYIQHIDMIAMHVEQTLHEMLNLKSESN